MVDVSKNKYTASKNRNSMHHLVVMVIVWTVDAPFGLFVYMAYDDFTILGKVLYHINDRFCKSFYKHNLNGS